MPKAAYDDIADWYEHEFLVHQRGGRGPGAESGDLGADAIGVDRAITELLGPAPAVPAGVNPACLEVGCGTGIYADRVRSLGWTPLGLDLSRAMLGYATDRLPVIWGDATRLPLASASIVAAIGVMIHSDIADYAEVLAEVNRVLQPGGRFVHVGVHPCFIGDFADRSDPDVVLVRPGYLRQGWTRAIGPDAGAVGRSGQVRDKVGAAHLPLSALLNAVIGAGFAIERTTEGFAPTPITFSLAATKLPAPATAG